MNLRTFGFAAALGALALLGACDRSRQTADGATAAGDAGTAAIDKNIVASTGSAGQGGDGGAGGASTVQAAGGTINQLDRQTSDAQSSGRQNEDTRAASTGGGPAPSR